MQTLSPSLSPPILFLKPLSLSEKTVFDPKGAAGVTAPFGFFDPLSLCPETEREFIKYREAELKHGRVAMLAFAGFFGE